MVRRDAVPPMLLSAAVCQQWLGILYYLQPFEATGVHVRTIIAMIYDVRWFLAIAFLVMIGAAHTFLVLLQPRNVDAPLPPEYANPWEAMFTMFATFLLMNFDAEPFAGQPDRWLLQVLVMFFTIVIGIVLVNLLIAIMGNSFGRISERAGMEQTLLCALTVVEMELLLPDTALQRTDWFPEYLHVLVPCGDNAAEEQPNNGATL